MMIDTEDFINEFIKKLVNLMRHLYIAKRKSIYFKSFKEKLQQWEGVLI